MIAIILGNLNSIMELFWTWLIPEEQHESRPTVWFTLLDWGKCHFVHRYWNMYNIWKTCPGQTLKRYRQQFLAFFYEPSVFNLKFTYSLLWDFIQDFCLSWDKQELLTNRLKLDDETDTWVYKEYIPPGRGLPGVLKL